MNTNQPIKHVERWLRSHPDPHLSAANQQRITTLLEHYRHKPASNPVWLGAAGACLALGLSVLGYSLNQTPETVAAEVLAADLETPPAVIENTSPMTIAQMNYCESTPAVLANPSCTQTYCADQRSCGQENQRMLVNYRPSRQTVKQL